MVTDDRAQVHTLEAFTAAFVLIITTTLTLQIASVQSIQGGNGQVEEIRTETLAEDVLIQSRSSGDLRTAILNWSGKPEGFNGTRNNSTYYSGVKNGVPGGLGDSLSALRLEGREYNIYLVCDGDRHPFVRNGRSGSNPAVASVSIYLTDDDRTINGTKLEDTPTYPCEDADRDSPFYNSVEVRMVAWST